MKSIRDLQAQANEPRTIDSELTASIVNALRSHPEATHHLVSIVEHDKACEAMKALKDAGYRFTIEINKDTPNSKLYNFIIQIR